MEFGPWATQANFARRARRYRLLDAEPAIRLRTSFFSAAATICDVLSGAPSRPFLSTISEELEHFNLHRAQRIRSGELYADGNIENNTIEFIAAEQAFVALRLCALGASHPRLLDAEIHAANRVLSLLSKSHFPCGPLALRKLATAAHRVQRDLLRAPRFEMQSDRELIGRQLALGAMLRD